MKPPIRNIPAELNRRLDDLERTTRTETIVRTVAYGSSAGTGGTTVTTPSVDTPSEINIIGVTETTVYLTATPSGAYLYEFALQCPEESEIWDQRLVKDPTILFTGLVPGRQYKARVRIIAEDGTPNSWSSTVQCQTNVDNIPPPPPEGLTVEAESYYIRGKVNPIDQVQYPDFDGFEWHADTASDFTPSDETFKATGRETRVMLLAQDVGITWYVKVRSYDTRGNYSEFCDQASVEIPPLSIPTVNDDPVGEGDIVICGGTTEIHDCDDYTEWESEASDAIRISAAPTCKEGTGAIRVEIDKYGFKESQEQDINGCVFGMSASSQYYGQRIKVKDNFNLKRISAKIEIYIGAPAGVVAHFYSDDGGNPNVSLGSAAVAGITGDNKWRHADLAAPVAVVAGTYYWLIWKTNAVDSNNFYLIRAIDSDHYEGESCCMGRGSSDALETRYPTWDLAFKYFSDEESLNKHFKISALGVKDLSGDKLIEMWVQGSKIGAGWLQASMGEAALGEQTHMITIPAMYETDTWDISAIADANKDAIAHFGFKIVDNEDDVIIVDIDYIRSIESKAVKVKFPEEVVRIYPAPFVPGFRDGCRPAWLDVASIYITKGAIEIDGFRAFLDDLLTVTWADLDVGAEAASTWYYLYLVKPPSDGGAPTAKISATAPSIGFRSRYHPDHSTWRCVGSFYNDAGSNLVPAYYSNDGWTTWDERWVNYSGTPSWNWTVVSMSGAPGTTQRVRGYFLVIYIDTTTFGTVRKMGSGAATGWLIGSCNPPANNATSADVIVEVDSQVRVQIHFMNATVGNQYHVGTHAYWEDL